MGVLGFIVFGIFAWMFYSITRSLRLILGELRVIRKAMSPSVVLEDDVVKTYTSHHPFPQRNQKPEPQEN